MESSPGAAAAASKRSLTVSNRSASASKRAAPRAGTDCAPSKRAPVMSNLSKVVSKRALPSLAPPSNLAAVLSNRRASVSNLITFSPSVSGATARSAG